MDVSDYQCLFVYFGRNRTEIKNPDQDEMNMILRYLDAYGDDWLVGPTNMKLHYTFVHTDLTSDPIYLEKLK